MTTEMNNWFERGYEEYLKNKFKEISEREAARFKRLKEKYPDAQDMFICSKEEFEKIYPGVEY